MIYPLDEPHLAALRSACEVQAKDEEHFAKCVAEAKRWSGAGEYVPITYRAALAISSPSSTAQLVRDLLARCGKPALIVTASGILDPEWPVRVYYMAADVPDVDPDDEDDDRCFDVNANAVPALILSLLDALALPDGRAEAALKALREVGR